MINFGHETEELEFKKSTSEMHDAMTSSQYLISMKKAFYISVLRQTVT